MVAVVIYRPKVVQKINLCWDSAPALPQTLAGGEGAGCPSKKPYAAVSLRALKARPLLLSFHCLCLTVLCARQDDVDKKKSDFFEELAIWEGYLSKVFVDDSFAMLNLLPN